MSFKHKTSTRAKTEKTALTVALMMGATVLAKLLGMLRTMFMAGAYGTGMEATAFTAAYRIPVSFFDMLLSAAIVGCFIPVYNSFTGGDGDIRCDSERSEFARVFLNFVLLLTGALTVLGIIFARPILSAVAPGLEPETSELAVSLLRIMFPTIIFIGAAYTLVGVMQSKGRYLLPAAISSVSNFCVIIYFIFINDRLGENGITGLTVAYLAAWFAQFLTLAIPLALSGSRYRPNFDFGNPAFRRALKMTPAIMVGSWLLPVGMLAGTYFATFTDLRGAVTVFDYSFNIYLIIAGTLVYSVCNYIFPILSRRSAEGDSAGFGASVMTGLLSLGALTLPFACGALLLSREGVAIMYLRGEFTALDAENVSGALRMLLTAVPAFAVNELFSRVFYSRGETRLPMYAALTGIGVNIACSTVSVRLLGLGLNAAALSNALGQYASAAVLIIFAALRLDGVFGRAFYLDLLRIALCAALSGAVMAAIYAFLPGGPYDRSFAANIAVCAGVFAPAAALYIILLKLTGFGPLRRKTGDNTKT